MTPSRNYKALLGWPLIAVGLLTILAIGFFNPADKVVDLAYRYTELYAVAVTLIAVGILVETE